MELIARLWVGVVLVLRLMLSAVSAVFGAVFGRVEYALPAWVGALKRTAIRFPLRSLAALLVLGAAGWAGHWWWTRPLPEEPLKITVSIEPPGATDYTTTPITIQPLRIAFSGSAAPLEALGKTASGLTLTPAVAGTWTWTSDNTLEMVPAGDWPIGQHFALRFDPQQTLAPNTLIDAYEFEFDTTAFSLNLASSEFYQDPEKPEIKRVLAEINFTHPVDTTSVQRRISLKAQDGAGKALATPEFSVRFDPLRLKAFVQSSPIALPENGGTVTVDVKAGMQAERDGAQFMEAQSTQVGLPALYSLALTNVQATLIDDVRGEPKQTLLLEASGAIRDQAFAQATSAWLLPLEGPDGKATADGSPYYWSTQEIDKAQLARATSLPLTLNAGEREFLPMISFSFSAPPKRLLLIEVKKGLKTDGGFVLGRDQLQVIEVPDYPAMLRFVGEGALLSLRGERRVSVVSRNHSALNLEVQRVLPEQLQHFVNFNEGSFGLPDFYSLNADVLTERFEKTISLPNQDAAKAHYEGIDLGEFLAPGKRGVFLLTLRAGEEGAGTETLDRRLIVLSDLGVIAKTTQNGSRAVFVASIEGGEPMAGVTVRAIGQNGSTLLSATTDADGRADIGNLEGFEREQRALMLTAELNDDLSFLPLNGRANALDYSRFDVGGEINPASAGALKAHLFSDRGMYRPGDTLNLGLLVRAADWTRPLDGLPLKLDITDARGQMIMTSELTLNADGLLDYQYPIAANAPTGVWSAMLYLMKNENERVDLGATEFKVREFEPDRIKVKTTLSASSEEGWVSPENLRATVQADNLFGTAAQNRRVSATLNLDPATPRFKRWPAFNFFDPRMAKEGVSEALAEGSTDESGSATFDLDLKRFAEATYRVSVATEVFEPEGGRSVAAFARTLVSSNPYLVGIKTPDPLDYVERNADRVVELVAIGPDANPIAVGKLSAVLVEQRFVSVLTKQESGVYKYESVLREHDVSQDVLTLGSNVAKFKLNTTTPGSYFLSVRDSIGKLLNRIDYTVAGEANLTRSLERNAELKLTLSKPEYRAGEEIEFSIIAPYAGAGLITIERERVVAQKWFKSDTTASVQRITLPTDFEGNGYVTVQFLRDIDSDEVFTSPLSYGVLPFTVDRSERRQLLEVRAPERSKPGEPMQFSVRTEGAAKVIVFAVDEGILQVAGYQLADPLDTFLRKRQLEVGTTQVLDLLLPEFSKLTRAAAPGGDAEGALAANLNPFKRKRDLPAVYWSRVVDVNGETTLSYTPPASFNGTLRVMAVAASPARIGTFVGTAQVRGDFVLSPNAPTTLAPGDSTELSVGVAYPPTPGATERMISVSATPTPGLKLTSPATVSIRLKPGAEGTVRFAVSAQQAIGPAELLLAARADELRTQQRVGISVRPIVPYDNFTRMGRVDKPSNTLDGLESMWNPLAKRALKVAATPLVLTGGLSAYLADFPHRCSEQILSQAMPALVIRSRPELGTVFGERDKDPINEAINTLRTRQNASGGFGLWTATLEPEPFVSAYAGLFLIEAQDRGAEVPRELRTSTLSYLQTLAQDRAMSSPSQLRARALAIYVLTRSGQVTTQLIAALEQTLKDNLGAAWSEDAAAVLLGASLKLLKADQAADAMIAARFSALGAGKPLAFLFDSYYDPLVRDALSLYLIAKHFPEQTKKLPAAAIELIVDPLARGQNNTLSSGFSVLALEAYAIRSAADGEIKLSALDAQGKASDIGSAQGWIVQANFSDAARALKIVQPSKRPLWYALNQSGYALQPPTKPVQAGMEMLREILDSSGKPLGEVQLGEEIEVRLKLRALNRNYLGYVAIVDLLPGGFELVEQPLALPEEGAEPAMISSDRLKLPGSTLSVDYQDQREDRLVLYASLGESITEYRYRIKATNTGVYAIPTIYANSMYERDIKAVVPGVGSVTVIAPKP